jgi:hypothetical protein
MSKKQLAINEMSQFPAALKKLWGPPPILPSEDPEAYWKFALAIAEVVDPADAIMWLTFLKDFVDYSWEIRELRKHKAQLIVVAKKNFLEENSDDDEAREQNERYLATPPGEAELFLESLPSLEAIDKLIEAAEGRRRGALREIGNYEAKLASRLRKASDDAIIEGECTETDLTPAASGNGPPLKADNDPEHDHVASDRGEPGKCSFEHRPADATGQGACLAQRTPPRLERLGSLRSPVVERGRGPRALDCGGNRTPRAACDGPRVCRSTG